MTAPVVYLVGATASGKKEVAAVLADLLGAVRLSLDALKVYRGMDLGTAKAGTRFLLTDLVDAGEAFSVGDYVQAAAAAVAEVRRQGKVPLFVGGTGLYLRALVRGLFTGAPVPREVREVLRLELLAHGAPALHAELAAEDPEAAARIHPHDAKRILRALEVKRHTGVALSEWQARHTRPPLDGPRVLIGLRRSKESLKARIRARVESMFARGLVAEVETLVRSGRWSSVAREAIGYREVARMLQGERDEEACREEIVRATWKLTRRQENWFRQFPEIRWIAADGGTAGELAAEAAGIVREARDGGG